MTLATAKTRSASVVRVTPLSRHVGADVSGIDLSVPLGDTDFRPRSSDAWMQHIVLRFRGQTLTKEQLLDFSRAHFGELDKRRSISKASRGSPAIRISR